MAYCENSTDVCGVVASDENALQDGGRVGDVKNDGYDEGSGMAGAWMLFQSQYGMDQRTGSVVAYL